MPFCNLTESETNHLQGAASEQDSNEVAIADYAVLLAENVMRRYVERKSPEYGFTESGGSTTSSLLSWYDAMKADAAMKVRKFPYPSLFLNPLPPEMAEYPYDPPKSLLASTARTTTTTTTTPYDDQNNGDATTRRGYRDMFAVNGGLSEVMTVLQGECGLAVVSPRLPSGKLQGVYLMSPDATSCTIVACRVGLHPQMRQRLMSAVGDVASSCDEELAWRCCETFTAAMGHFDNAQGVEETLYEMLWEVALPAWFHAVLLGNDGVPAGNGVLVDAVTDLLVRLRRVAQTAGTTTTTTITTAAGDLDAPLFLTEWFVVGGVRSRKHTLPVLTAIFGALFSAEGDVGSEGCSSSRRRRCILRPSFSLSEVFGEKGGRCELDGASVRLEHRLREDGICFWSLNTVLRQWALGRPGESYSCPASLGLLIDVASGGCWPATVCPGTRTYPLAALRYVTMQSGYRWTCPLEREGALRVYRGAVTARATAYFGLRATPPAEGNTDISLAAYVALFLQRREHDLEAKEDKLPVPLPIIVRRGVWERVRGMGAVDDIADTVFLMSSTTPHCEPPDFAAMGRQRLSVMAEFDVDDVFADGTVGILV